MIIPEILLKESSNNKGLLKDIKNLTIEDVIVLYAYAVAIVETVREPLIILDEKLRIKTANKAFFEMFRVNKDETYNKAIFEIGNGQWNIPSLKELLKNILPQNSHFDDYEVNHTFDSIGERTIVLNARRIVLEGHKTHLILLAMEDITEKKEIEQVQQAESHLAAIITSSEDAIISKNLNSIILTWNKSAEKLFGYKAEEAIGKHIFLIIPPELRGEEDHIISSIKKGQRIEHFETTRVTKNGTRIPISLTISPIKDRNGRIIGASKIARDISEQKKAAERLKTSQDNMKFLSQASKVLSSSLDYKTTLTNVAKLAIPSIADWCSVDMFDEKGQIQQVVVAHKDPHKVKWAKALRKTQPIDLNAKTGLPQVLRSGKADFYPVITDEMLVNAAKNKKELKLMREIGFTSVILVPIFTEKKCVGAITLVTAETKRHYTKEDLSMAEELASRVSFAIINARLYQESQKEIIERKKIERQKDEFIGIASHELKTPVTSIKSFAQVLQLRFKKEGNQKAAELLGKLDAQVDKLTSLIGDLLDVTKIDAGRVQFNDDYFIFDELVEEIREELQRTTNTHTLQKRGSTGKTIYGDRERIGQVITNLISNAIKYSPHSKEIIIISSVDKENVGLCVQDFGVGIAKEKQEKVFERFFRVSGPGKETYPGLGLGLYISSEIIKRSQGRIWVESREGKGSTFCFTLPFKRKEKKVKSRIEENLLEETIKHG